jgi:hypothetical protein
MKRRRNRIVPQQEPCQTWQEAGAPSHEAWEAAKLEHRQLNAWETLLEGLLAVCRARERGEPYWALDVRRAAARIASARASLAEARTKSSDQKGS